MNNRNFIFQLFAFTVHSWHRGSEQTGEEHVFLKCSVLQNVSVFLVGSLSRKVFGRIQMKNLSESFVKDPGPLFPTGMLLTVAVLR